jgi:Uma2 family endonuclease
VRGRFCQKRLQSFHLSVDLFGNASSTFVHSLTKHMNATAELIERVYHAPNAALILESVRHRLENDRQKREEYYALVHEDVKAEFINGEIVYQSPVQMRYWDASMEISGRLYTFVKERKLGKVGIEKVMISLTRNDYEPDICFFSAERASTFTPEQMHFPAPDFVVEIISKSTEGRDRGVKFIDYAAHGVREYWIADPLQQTLEQYVLEGEQPESVFTLRQKLTGRGTCESVVLLGFSVDILEIFV